MNSIILSSSNQGKIAEFAALFSRQGIEIIPQKLLGIDDAVEDGLSFIENAILKARHAARIGGQPAIADDSGLVVPSLHGEPGIYSARYSGEHGNDIANNAKLLNRLNNITDRKAFFVCVIAYVEHADDPLPIVATGLWHGRILTSPQGENGFGYDPLFLPDGQTQSAAEMDKVTKNSVSHRGQAMAAFWQLYRERKQS